MITELNTYDIAIQKVKLFDRQFGSEYRLLAYHAALPLVLTPELLHYLRTEFLLNNREIGWEAEADLLLSDLCAQVGYELYAMDSDVRSYLLAEMSNDPRIPEDRMSKVAQVLISYVAYLSRVNPGQRQQELQAQKWAAMTYLGEAECRQAVEEIIAAFTESSDRGNSNAVKAEFARLARITEKLVQKLGDNHPLIKHARSVNLSLKDPSVNIPREDLITNIPWLPSIVEPKLDRSDKAFPEFTSFEFDVAEFVEESIAPLQRIPHRFEVATIEIGEQRNFFGLGNKSTPKIIIDRQRKQDWQYVETLAPDLTLELIQIPAGSFMMGAPKSEAESRDNECPQHFVEVPEFYLGKYPITQAQWKFGAGLPKIERDLDPDPSRFKGKNLPVECVSWFDAIEFCARLSQHTGREYRLPSEAEWEYACRAGTTTPFHFGETIDPQVANYNSNHIYGRGQAGKHRAKTTPVGSFKVANNFGLFDMHGNVLELCQDPWHSSYQDAPRDGSAWLVTESPETYFRVVRGGSWNDHPRNCRSALRDGNYVVNRGINHGFRVVYSPARTL
jgi:formylglycine-generating enzyme required for sulfatase activity